MKSSHSVSNSEISNLILNTNSDEDIKSSTSSITSQLSAVVTSPSDSTSTEIGQEQIDHIRDAFAVFDKEMTGSITTEQFR